MHCWSSPSTLLAKSRCTVNWVIIILSSQDSLLVESIYIIILVNMHLFGWVEMYYRLSWYTLFDWVNIHFWSSRESLLVMLICIVRRVEIYCLIDSICIIWSSRYALLYGLDLGKSCPYWVWRVKTCFGCISDILGFISSTSKTLLTIGQCSSTLGHRPKH